MTMLARLKPYNKKKGCLIRRFTVFGVRFQEERGWYKVDDEVAAYLQTVHQDNNDPDSTMAFDVCTQDEAEAMESEEKAKKKEIIGAIHSPLETAADSRTVTRKGIANFASKRARAQVLGTELLEEEDEDIKITDLTDLTDLDDGKVELQPSQGDISLDDLPTPSSVKKSIFKKKNKATAKNSPKKITTKRGRSTTKKK